MAHRRVGYHRQKLLAKLRSAGHIFLETPGNAVLLARYYEVFGGGVVPKTKNQIRDHIACLGLGVETPRGTRSIGVIQSHRAEECAKIPVPRDTHIGNERARRKNTATIDKKTGAGP